MSPVAGYLGRVVAIGLTRAGTPAVAYRVSSRAFADRTATLTDGGAAILPRPGHAGDLGRNAFIAYGCLAVAGGRAVVSNGSHTQILADRLAAGHAPRDALMTVLAVMDYEHDGVGTPRIAGIVDAAAGEGYLGVVTPRALHVAPALLRPGCLAWLATSVPDPTERGQDDGFDADTPEDACRYLLGGGPWQAASHPVAAAAALWCGGGWRCAVTDAAAG